ncbi:MAG: CoA-binding protein [Trueperaceae bacterium]
MSEGQHDNTTAGRPQTAPDAPPDAELRDLLGSAERIAVIGASTREGRPANYVPAYLAERGYQVVGVNPAAEGETLFGQSVVAALADLSEPVDIVNVFRRNEDIPGHLDDILALNPRPRAVWIQLGLRNDEAAEVLRAAGITVVQNRCLMVEHRRLTGAADG